MSLSLDGYFEGLKHDLSWHNIDDEFNRWAIQELKNSDLHLYGRRTYQLMEAAWPKIAQDPRTSKDDLIIANLINNTNKVVYSTKLRSVEETEHWKNVKLLRRFDPAQVRKWKKQAGKEISVVGSSLALSFLKSGLIDRFSFMVNPVILGRGTPIFKGITSQMNVKLVRSQRFASGNVLLEYARSDRVGQG